MPNKPTEQSKQQHYIPQFYLKGFTTQKKLWVCEVGKPIRCSKPKEEAHREDYYTHSERGSRDEAAEDILKVLESQVAPSIRRLANREYKMQPKEAGALYLFVAGMFARVPSWREYVNKGAAKLVKGKHQELAKDKERFYENCRRFETDTGKTLEVEPEKLRQFIVEGEYDVQASVSFDLNTMLESTLVLFNELVKYGYQILYAPPDSLFVTSDAPVCTVLPDGKGQAKFGVGFGWAGTEVFFPLNKRTCLYLAKNISEPASVQASQRRVCQINRLVMMCAGQCLYASQGHRRTARLFDQYGCRVRLGKESFLTVGGF